MPFKQIKNSYNAGELSEYMAGRTDVAKYYNGASKMINATVLPHGGAVRRTGTEFIGKAPNKCKLFPFEFSVDDTMMLEFSNLLIRFYKDGDRVYEDAIDILSTTEDDPVEVTTDGSHGFSTGEWVLIEDVGTATSLNDKIYRVTVIDADEFSLQDTEGNDIDGTGIGVGSGGTVKRVYQIVSPYTSDEAFEIHIVQSADVIYIAHENHYPQKLTRLGDTNWTIEDAPLTGGPFLDENIIDSYTLGFARTGGTARDGYYFPAGATGTLTAAGHTPFLGTSDDVGTIWLLKHTRPDNILSTADNDDHNEPTGDGIRIKGDFVFECSTFASGETVKLWRKAGNGQWQQYRTFSAATALSATEDDDDVFYTFTRDKSGGGETTVSTLTAKSQTNRGIVKVTSASSTTVANVIVIDPVLSDNAGDTAVTTSMWAEGAWSERRGYPRTVEFYEDRLWWASTTNDPSTMWSSRSSQYEDMSFTDLGLDDEAVTAPVQGGDLSQIQWMMARRVMAVATANMEFRFGASDIDKPTTPSDRKQTPQTSFGSDSIQPVILNNAIFFFQRNGRKLRAMKFDSIAENFQADDATLLANTMFESAPATMASQRVPDSVIWITREDGTLVSFTYEPDEEVAGWARHFTQNSASVENPTGYFECVAVKHGDIEDEVWVSVRRVIDSTTVRYVERFSPRLFGNLNEALMLDSAKTVVSEFAAQDIILASDTVRYGSGSYGSGLYGGASA